MAFCGNCGTQLNDGAKFCPKCGQPTSEVSNAQNQSDGSNFDFEPEEQIKTWQKIVCVLFWPIGAIITIVAFFKKQQALAKSALLFTAIGIAIAIVISIAGSKEEDSGTSTKTENISSVDVVEKDKQTEQKSEQSQEEKQSEQKSKKSKEDEIRALGHNDGVKYGYSDRGQHLRDFVQMGMSKEAGLTDIKLTARAAYKVDNGNEISEELLDIYADSFIEGYKSIVLKY